MTKKPPELDIPFDEALARIAKTDPREMRESMGHPYGTAKNPVIGQSLPALAEGEQWKIVGRWPFSGNESIDPQMDQAIARVNQRQRSKTSEKRPRHNAGK
jgi:hypothetical protein